jgi:hypothetical protein
VTATAILDLERAGFTREQVEALAHLIEAQTATKGDVAGLEVRMAEMEGRLRSAIADAKSSLLMWMFGVAAGQLGVLFAFLKLFPGGHP